MKKLVLLSSILIFCIMPDLACVSKEKQPKVYNPDGSLPTIPKEKMQGSSNGEKSGRGKDKKENRKEEEKLLETYRLQYEQLLETHRVYFGALLFTLSTYLAVMGACLTIVGRYIMKKGSKTLSFSLILFAVVASGLFMVGLYFGENDAMKRTQQITDVANQKLFIAPVEVKLLEDIFRWIAVGPVFIISLWGAVLFRVIMIYGREKFLIVRKRLPEIIVSSLIIAVIWIAEYILYALRPSGLFRRDLVYATISVGVWFLFLFITGVIVCYRGKTAQ
jgi:hypothetical protein